MPTRRPGTHEDVAGRLRASLATVKDPCSVHNGTNLTFTDLGMIEDVTLDDEGNALVSLVIDDPVCVYMVEIMSSLRTAGLAVEGVTSVDVEILGEQLWTPDRMTPQATELTAHWEQARMSHRALPIVAVS